MKLTVLVLALCFITTLAFADVTYVKINDYLFKSIDNGVEITYDINVIKAERANKDIALEYATELDNLIAEYDTLNPPAEEVTPPPEPIAEPIEVVE